MNFDFEQPITAYELVALLVSIIWPIVLMVVTWVYDKYVKKLKFDFIPSGMITLYFDNNGSYFTLGGVYEAEHKSATVQNITALVERESDKAVLNLRWSTFSPPKVRIIAGNVEMESETAHPFKVESDTLFPVLVGFENANENICEKFSNLLQPIHNAVTYMVTQQHLSPEQINVQVRQISNVDRVKQGLNDDFFWRSGVYHVKLATKYNNLTLNKKCTFTLSEVESNRIRNNIDTLLIEPMARYYFQSLPFSTIPKEFVEIS